MPFNLYFCYAISKSGVLIDPRIALRSRPCLTTLMYEPAGEIGSKIPRFPWPDDFGQVYIGADD